MARATTTPLRLSRFDPFVVADADLLRVLDANPDRRPATWSGEHEEVVLISEWIDHFECGVSSARWLTVRYSTARSFPTSPTFLSIKEWGTVCERRTVDGQVFT